jgi:hypothetical protein
MIGDQLGVPKLMQFAALYEIQLQSMKQYTNIVAYEINKVAYEIL